jgi:hypothetical protein
MVWLTITSALLVMVMVTAMAWTGTYDLEIFFSLWILWIIVAVLLLSPRNVRPPHLSLLSLGVVLGLLVFTLIVAPCTHFRC